MVVVLRGDVHLGGNHVELEVILAVMVISAAVILGELGGNRTGLLGGGFQTNRAGLGALIASLLFSSISSRTERMKALSPFPYTSAMLWPCWFTR